MSATVENKKVQEAFTKEFFGKPAKLPGKHTPIIINYLTATWNTLPTFARKFGCKSGEVGLLASWYPINGKSKADLKELPAEFMGLKVFYKKGQRIKAG